MGQYYSPVIADQNNILKTASVFDFDNGAKLMEHSYIGNNFVSAILHELVITAKDPSPKRLWWMGDYAELSDVNPAYRNILESITNDDTELSRHMISSLPNISPNKNNQKWEFNKCYAVNHDKNEYIVLPDDTPDDYVICAVSLLTAVGNGRGGGDYYGTNTDAVGTWAGDRISIWYDLPTEYKDTMVDKTTDYTFVEEW